MYIVILATILVGYDITKGNSDISTPVVGNCGDDTVISCKKNISNPNESVILNLNGTLVTNLKENERTDKYSITETEETIRIMINGIDVFKDSGQYTCVFEFTRSTNITVATECKAKSIQATVDSTNRLQFAADRLYPDGARFTIKIDGNTQFSTNGDSKCEPSHKYNGYYKCVWTSAESLDDGTYSYNVTVKTLTDSENFIGNVTIVSPLDPILKLTEHLDDGREVIRGNEGGDITISCLSQGGFPSPNVSLYLDPIQSEILNGTSMKSCDSTCNITLTFTLTSVSRSYDGQRITCISWYPNVDVPEKRNTSVYLYLNLKPEMPKIEHISEIVSGKSVNLKCFAENCRPAAIIYWEFNDYYNITGTVTYNNKSKSDVYTSVSYINHIVTASDNGREVRCKVYHPTLEEPLIVSVELNVSYSPCVPTNFTVRDIQTTSVLLTWNRCLHDGLNQAFIIQLSMDSINWTNITTVYDDWNTSRAPLFHRLHSLEGSSTYHVRLVAYNEAGMSNYSTTCEFTTKDLPIPFYIISIVSVITGNIIIIVSVIIIKKCVFKKRKDAQNIREDEQNRNEAAAHNNPAYIEMEDHIIPGAENVYATVNKTRVKTSAGASSNAATDTDLPENGEHNSSGNRTEAANLSDKAVYENCNPAEVEVNNSTGIAIGPSVKEKRNSGELVYVDLAFNNQAPRKTTLVVRGLDDRTPYAEVDFTRTADPLPDSDSEEEEEQM